MMSFLTSVMTSHGYLALIVLAFLEACCIPISSEITFALGGLLASQHKLALVLVIIIGTAAEMGGSLTSYAAGRAGGRPLLERYGKWVLVTRADLDRAERLFAGRGSWIVAIARALPIVRCFAGFGAGVVEVPAAPFAFFSLIGTAAWATALSLFGYELGPAYRTYTHTFTLAGIVLLALAVAGLVGHRVHALRQERQRETGAATAGLGRLPDRDAEAAGLPPQPAGETRRPGGAHRGGRPAT